MSDNKKLWDQILTEIELAVSKANFTTWFRDTYIVKQEEGTIYVSVPNAFVKDWLFNKYHKTILKLLREFNETVRALEYIVTRDDVRKREMESQKNTPEPTTSLPLQDFYINKDDNLNPRYTFESFVVGPFNELAHAASQAIIKKPGIVYNPLFIYGNTGHGKTHLIQAVGNQIKAVSTQKKVFYVTSEKFAIDYINSVQVNNVGNFKEKYRKYDVLIMDDIQFLSNKEKTQEELFHLFNNLYDDNKQIIFSSDKHPNYIPHLDQESRAAIIRAKAKMQNFELSPDIVDYLALTIDGNIRDLEGTLNSVIMHSQIKGRELN